MIRGGMNSNPRRRRRGRRRHRRNPSLSLSGGMSSIKKVFDPALLTQIAAGAAGATVSEMFGSLLASKVANATGQNDPTSMGNKLIGALSRIAAGLLTAMIVPGKYKSAWILGSGTMAAQPLVSGLLAPVLAPIAKSLGLSGFGQARGGIGGWIAAADVGHIGRLQGMGAWITNKQMANGFRGMRGLGSDSAWDYGVPVGAMSDYSRQPAAYYSSMYGSQQPGMTYQGQ